MKKLLLPIMLSLTLCNSAMGYEYDESWCNDGDDFSTILLHPFTTGQHTIKVSEYTRGRFVYEAWNVPKDMMDDAPDWVMEGGRVCSGRAKNECLYFQKGNTEFVVEYTSQSDPLILAELTIYINGRRKQHYWLRNWYPRICNEIN